MMTIMGMMRIQQILLMGGTAQQYSIIVVAKMMMPRIE